MIMDRDKDTSLKLFEAARNGHWSEIASLRDDGEDIDRALNIVSEHPFFPTVLSEASKHGQFECVQKLLEIGVCGNDDDDETMMKYKFALEMAALEGHLECFRLLVEDRLFKAVDDRQNYDIFIDLSRKGDFDQIQKILAANTDEDFLYGWKGNNLMSLFIVYGCPPSCLQLLIDQNVNVNGFDYNGFTPLTVAVLTRNMKYVDLLLEQEVDVNVLTINSKSYFLDDGRNSSMAKIKEEYRGATALMYAACFRNSEILRELLRFCSLYDDNIDLKNGRCWTALDYAVYFGNKDSVSKLIESCANIGGGYVSVKPDQKHYFSMKHHRPDILELTLRFDHNASETVFHNTDLCLSDIHCLRVLVRYLKRMNRNFNRYLGILLLAALDSQLLECVDFLVDEGADVCFQNVHGITPLMRSCVSDMYEKVFDLLVEKGADIHFVDNSNNTAVMFATKSETDKCLRKLQSLGANLHILNKLGQTALIYACQYARNEDVINFLIQQGVAINAPDKNGLTAAMCAASSKNDQSFKALFNKNADLDLSDIDGQTVFHFALCGDAVILDLLLQSGKLFNNGVLKPVHALLKEKYYEMSTRCLMSTIRYGIFEWNWFNCQQPMYLMAFVAVVSGISPGKITYKETEVSLFRLAFIQSDFSSILYLLANRYLLLEDLRMMHADEVENMEDNISSLVKKFCAEPLSLKTLCFLTISKALSLAGSSLERSRLVDALPLPELMKRSLKFETNVSKQCFGRWHRIEMGSAFDNFNFRNEIAQSDDMIECSCWQCHCQGLGLCLHGDEEYSDELYSDDVYSDQEYSDESDSSAVRYLTL